MARFDKRWLFVHVPAGLVVVALLGFGIVQCDGKNDETAEKIKVQNQLIDAGKKMEIAASRMDSLLNVNHDLGADNVRKGDTIRVLKDSVDTLNGQVRELKHDNDSLVVALTDCRNSKKKQQPAKKVQPVKKKSTPVAADKPVVAPSPVTPSSKPTVENTWVPSKPVPSRSERVECAEQEVSTATVHMDASYNNGNVLVDNAPTNTNIRLDNGAVNNGNIVVGGANSVGTVSAQQANIGMTGAHNNGNVIVENGARITDVSLDGRAVNNGAIVVGNANTVYNVTPDTIVRFTTTKNRVVKCRVITKQRVYR